MDQRPSPVHVVQVRTGQPGAIADVPRAAHLVEPVPVGPPGRPLIVVAWLVLALVVVLIVKPWQSSGQDGGGLTGASFAIVTATVTPTAAPSATPLDQCLLTAGWRVYTFERAGGQQLATWYAVHPSRASGPDDASIPLIRVFAQRLLSLGFCAPLIGPDRAPGPPEVAIWRAAPTSGANGVTATPWRELDLRGLGYVSTNPFATGDVFAAPPDLAVALAGTWPDGTYVFRVATADGNWVRWFAAVVQTVTVGVLPSAAPSPAGSPTAAAAP